MLARNGLRGALFDKTRRQALPGVAGALISLVSLFIGTFGLTWDVQWHIWIGRDRFWSPPHVMLYVGVIVCSAVYVSQVYTALKRGLRPAPGYLLGSVGIAGLVVAGPFDELWHRIYGLDLDMWTPAHLLALVSGTILALTVSVVWAQIVIQRRNNGWSWPMLGFLCAAAGTFGFFLIVTQPAINKYPTTDLGALHVLTLPIIQAAPLAFVLLSAALVLRRPGAALALVALLWIRQAIFVMIIPPLVVVGAAIDAVPFRWPVGVPAPSPANLLVPLLLIPAAVAVELALLAPGRLSLTARATVAGALVALAQLVIAPLWLTLGDVVMAAAVEFLPDLLGRPGAGLSALDTLPAAIPVALGSAMIVALLVARGLGPRARRAPSRRIEIRPGSRRPEPARTW